MEPEWRAYLSRWINAGLLDEDTATRIEAFEKAASGDSGVRWPVAFSLVFGAVLLAAGMMLLAAAQWDELAPPLQMGLSFVPLAAMHAGGILASSRSAALSRTFHALGTIACGAALLLCSIVLGTESWAEVLFAWAIAAAAGYIALNDWIQWGMAMVLWPAWFVAQWWSRGSGVEMTFIALVSLVYLGSAKGSEPAELNRRVLVWCGGFALLPAVLMIAISGASGAGIASWVGAVAVPLIAAVWLRREALPMIALGAVWLLVLAQMTLWHQSVWMYLWCLLGSLAMCWWGVIEERSERIDLGVGGFGLTIVLFYFSSVMDRLGRSASLITLGVLFLAGGYGVERMRRWLHRWVKRGRA